MLSCFSRVWLFATPWTVARQAPLSIEFSRQEYWSGLPCPPSRDLPNPGIKPTPLMPQLASKLFTTSAIWEAHKRVSFWSNLDFIFGCNILWFCFTAFGDCEHPPAWHSPHTPPQNLFNWNITDLQCGANFYRTTKWLLYTHTHTHTYTYAFFLYSFFHYGFPQETIVPCNIQ